MKLSTIAAFCAAVALAACASVDLTAQESPQARTGEEIFADKCIYCHDTRGWGTRILARRTPEDQAELTRRESLPAAYTSLVVRRGIGSMPGFTPTDLTDEEVAEVARWLDELN